MKIFTAAQVKQWDEFTVEEQGITQVALIQRAATACYEWIAGHISANNGTCFHIFCGPGNNGADGLALAGLLYQEGYKIKTYLLPGKTCANNDVILQGLQKFTKDIITIESKNDFPILGCQDVVVDAMFGTGLNRALESIPAQLVKHINAAACTVISLDIPSGMRSDESSLDAVCIHAHHSLTFEHYKTALLLPENAPAFGSVQVLHIGLSEVYAAKETSTYQFITREMLQKIYQPRKAFAHKGHFGHAYLVAGSTGKMGAAVLAAKACLAAGVGLLTVQVPREERLVLQVSTPEAMLADDDRIDVAKYASIAVGPGWGTSVEHAGILESILKTIASETAPKKPVMVLDADALNTISQNPYLLKLLPPGSILTPHPKEFERLFGSSKNDFARLSLALEQAASLQCYIILKGHHSFIACPNGEGLFNGTGNAGMAKGGSGDVLTGMIAGLASQGYSQLHACMLAVYLHGLAADIAVQTHSQEALLATHIIEHIGKAFLHIRFA